MAVYMTDDSSCVAGVIERSVLHMLLGAGDDRAQAAWIPGPDMLAASLGLPPHTLPGPDARMFVEQAVLAVRLSSHTQHE